MTQRASQGHSESRQGPSEERPSVPWSLGRLHSGFSRPWSRTVNRHAVGWTSGSRAWPQAGRSGVCVCGGVFIPGISNLISPQRTLFLGTPKHAGASPGLSCHRKRCHGPSVCSGVDPHSHPGFSSFPRSARSSHRLHQPGLPPLLQTG